MNNVEKQFFVDLAESIKNTLGNGRTYKDAWDYILNDNRSNPDEGYIPTEWLQRAISELNT